MTLSSLSAGPSTAAEAMSIELIEVTKRYSSAVAVDSVDLTISGGQFVALLGPSGCGKSTLLKLISGLETVTSGEVYLDGQLANYVRPKNRNVAMVFQNYALYPHMTVEENLAFPLAVRRQQKSLVASRVREVASFVELGEHLKKFPDQLSGGQRQRVALGRAIIREPRAFLMDEPLSNLDALLRVQMRTDLLKLHRKIGRTTVYVTHDQTEAMTMADQVVVMREGVVQQIGTPEQLYNQPSNTFVATFVGAPQMNLFAGVLAERNGKPFFDSPVPVEIGAALPQGTPTGPLTIGIRPEDILLCSATQVGAVPGQVELVESVGPDCYLTVNLAGLQSATVRVPTDDKVGEGANVNIRFRPDRLRFFDGDGQALGR